MIKIKLKKWMKKVTAPVTITNVSLPFTPNCNGFLFVLLRANTQGRVYETFINTTPNIADGYAVAGGYVNVLLFVEKGKAVSSSAIYNTQGVVVHYFIPLVGGVLRNLSIFNAFRRFMSLQKALSERGCVA